MITLKSFTHLIITILFSAFVSTTVLAQQAPAKKTEHYILHKHIIHSKILNEDRTVTVQLPKGYSSHPNRHYPVIYRLDGVVNLPIMNTILETLQSAQYAPEVIIVAIENPNRFRDLYATVNKDPMGPLGVGGGAAKFLDFIADELIPLVNKHYRTHDFRIIAGASAAGNFALYTMVEKPGLFQAHIGYSPAVWWDNAVPAKRIKAFLTKTKQLDSYVYMDIGNEAWVMRPVYDDLVQFMQSHQPKGLKLITDVFPNVPHRLTDAAGIFNAYQNLFYPLSMPVAKFSGDVSSITDYYQRLSRQYGETVKAPEHVVREMGYYFLQQKHDLPTAIKLFKFDISLHPDSPDSYNGLAYGYESEHKYKQSLEQVNKALALSTKDTDGYDVFVGRHKRLLKLLNKS